MIKMLIYLRMLCLQMVLIVRWSESKGLICYLLAFLLQGLKIGDQILEVNGHNFNNITHAEAVMIMRNAWNLIILVERPMEKGSEGIVGGFIYTSNWVPNSFV